MCRAATRTVKPASTIVIVPQPIERPLPSRVRVPPQAFTTAIARKCALPARLHFDEVNQAMRRTLIAMETVSPVSEHQASAHSALTLLWSGRVIDKVPSSNGGARAAQLNR
jgi:hypothetical protein